MGVNVYFHQETHKISHLPATLHAFLQVLKSLFQDKLPQSWNLWFVDSKGNNRTIHHDSEYVQLRNQECKTTCLTIDFFIVPSKNIEIPLSGSTPMSHQPQILSQSLYQSETPVKSEYLTEEAYPMTMQAKDFQFQLEKPFKLNSTQVKNETPDTWDNGSFQEEKQSVSYFGELPEETLDFSSFEDFQLPEFTTTFSQYKWEKTAEADHQMVFVNENLNNFNEVFQPRASLQPQNEGTNTEKMLKAIRLVQKLGTKTLNEGKILRTFEKIKKIEVSLSSQEGKELQKFKDNVVSNFWKNQNLKKGGLCAPVQSQKGTEGVELYETKHKVVLLENTQDGSVNVKKAFDPISYEDNQVFFSDFETECSSILNEKPVIQNTNRFALAFEAMKKMMNAVKSKNAEESEKYMNILFAEFPQEVKEIINSDLEWNYEQKEMIVSEWREFKRKNEESKVQKFEVQQLVSKLRAHQEALRLQEEQSYEPFPNNFEFGFSLVDIIS